MGLESGPIPNRRPTTLIERGEIDGKKYIDYLPEQFPERENFEKEADNVQFARPLDTSDEGPVWAFVPRNIEEATFFGANRASAVISRVSESKKFSKGYNACTGLAAIGIDKETGKPISFLSHIDPSTLLGSYNGKEWADDVKESKEIVAAKLKERIREMQDRCDPSTLSFEIVGGGFGAGSDLLWKYRESVTYLGDIAEEVLGEGQRPLVTFGPNTNLGSEEVRVNAKTGDIQGNGERIFNNTDVYIDTPSRGVIIVRPMQRDQRWNNGFIAPRMDDAKGIDEWKQIFDSNPKGMRGAGDGVVPFPSWREE